MLAAPSARPDARRAVRAAIVPRRSPRFPRAPMLAALSARPDARGAVRAPGCSRRRRGGWRVPIVVSALRILPRLPPDVDLAHPCRSMPQRQRSAYCTSGGRRGGVLRGRTIVGTRQPPLRRSPDVIRAKHCLYGSKARLRVLHVGRQARWRLTRFNDRRDAPASPTRPPDVIHANACLYGSKARFRVLNLGRQARWRLTRFNDRRGAPASPTASARRTARGARVKRTARGADQTKRARRGGQESQTEAQKK